METTRRAVSETAEAPQSRRPYTLIRIVERLNQWSHGTMVTRVAQSTGSILFFDGTRAAQLGYEEPYGIVAAQHANGLARRLC